MDKKGEKIENKLEVVETPFAEGQTRLALKARVVKGTYEGYPEGTDLVLKVIKPEHYNQGLRLGEEDVLVQKLASKYCKEFNRQGMANKRVYAIVGRIVTAQEDAVHSSGGRIMVKGEQFLIEQRIYGRYQKFNSNGSWSSGEFALPDFFSHWTWVESGGKHLVCDLQGYRGRPGGVPYGKSHDYYVFTDPVVMSDTRDKYGITDLGADGIETWFSGHRCNWLCLEHGYEFRRPASIAPKQFVLRHNTTQLARPYRRL